jgi:peptide/nickel transport system substrate-binding protein
MILPRRRFLGQLGAGASAIAIALADARRARAMGRTPVGGRVVFHVPWPLGSLDPHDLFDPAAALFASAVADPVYALEPSGAPYPTLAVGMPVREAGETIVHLREGLRSARLAPIDARDLFTSVERARRMGGAAVLAEVPRPLLRKTDPLAVVFGDVDPGHLARALASPLVALLPRRFNPATPDGTGAFRADISSGALTLTRNLAAARGPAFLDSVEITPADDLKASLRAFEAELDDLGWLGMGLHDGRAGALRFDLGRVAWVVLVVGTDAGVVGVPGAAQRLVDAVPPERLAHLGLGFLPPATGDPTWPAPPAELLVDGASPHLLEVARAMAPVISAPGHEVTVTPLPRVEIAARRARGKATLAIELLRPLGPGAHHTLMALGSAEDPARGRELSRAPFKPAQGTPARALTGLLRVGVIGEVRVAGGVIPDVVLARSAAGEGWDLGASFRRLPRRPP